MKVIRVVETTWIELLIVSYQIAGVIEKIKKNLQFVRCSY